MWPKCTPISRLSAFVSLSLSLLVAAPVLAQTTSSNAPFSSRVPVAARLTQPVNDQDLVPLQGTVHRLATAANDRGAADAGLPLERMQLSLKRSAAQETALQQTIQQMHTPGSPLFHKWLTPAQFGEQFGPSDSDIATISSWLGTHGFMVTKVNAGKQTMEISGTAGQFSSTFHSQIHKYQVNGQMHYANASDPQIPAALAPVFGGFASLNNFQLKSLAKTRGTASYDPSTHRAVPTAKAAWTTSSGGEIPNLLLAPGDFAVQYDLNPLYTAGIKGAGQTIGIINEANVDPTLVAQFRSLFGLPASPVNVIVDGNDPGIDGVNNPDGPNGASIESYLDVEESGAVAPAATIDLIIGADTALNSGLSLAAEHAVYGNVAPVLSISFLGCEVGQGTFWNDLWEQAAAQGQTVMVSSGDAGSAGCDDDDTQYYAVNGQRVNGIASTPYDVAVGGTDFYYSDYLSSSLLTQLGTYWNLTTSNTAPTVSLLQRVPEQPWNDSQYGLDIYTYYFPSQGYDTTSIAGGGGGPSNCATGSGSSCKGYAKPGFQSALTPADGVRDTPDVSLFASNAINATIYPICASNGDCQPASSGSIQITEVGGTSASSPAFAGIMALVNEKYGPQGQANFVLYPLAKQFPAAFNDVTVGSNSVPCNVTNASYQGQTVAPDDCIAVSNPDTVDDPTFGSATEGQIGSTTTKAVEYSAGPGYDLASGLGSVDANVLVTDWNKITFATSTVTLVPSSTSFAHGTTITVLGTVTPATATGTVSLETTSTEPLQSAETTFTVTNGTFTGTLNYLPGGSYSIYGAYSGDGTNGASTSAKTAITVTQQASATSLEALNSVSSGQNGVTAAFGNGATIAYGTQVLLDAEPLPSPTSTSYGTPTGTVNYLSGTSSIGSASVNATGEASLNYAPVPSSTPYSITAAYSGDASYAASTSGAVTFTVIKDTPALLLSTGSQTSTTLTAVSGLTALTVGVENSANQATQNQTGAAFVNSAVAPTGVVTITGLPSGTLTFPALSADVSNNTLFPEGVATLPLPTEAAGTYALTISYPGDANYGPMTATASITITTSSLVATDTIASASVGSTTSSKATTVTFTVTGTNADGFPTGSVAFLVSGISIGSVTLPSTGSSDSVTETVGLDGLLAAGENEIVVQYSGNTVYATSYAIVDISNGGTTVTPTTGTITLTNSGGITIASPGNGGTSAITATLGGGLTASGVTLSCSVASAVALAPTCSVGALSGSATAPTATLTVSTTAASAELKMPKMGLLPIGGGVTMATLLFLLVPAKRRRIGSLLGALVLVALVGFASGCSGGGSPTGGSGNSGTPTGTYTVTVTGTASGVTTATTSVTVTVQ